MSPSGGSAENLGSNGAGDHSMENYGAQGSLSFPAASNDADVNNQRSDGAAEADEIISEEVMKEKASESPWHILPQELKNWSIDTAKKISNFVEEKAQDREKIKRSKKEATELDRCLEEAESEIKKK